jgi:hypothetical protein
LASKLGERYALPPATTLYYDGRMPEGFSRYYVYANVFGPPLKHEAAPKINYKAPLSAEHNENGGADGGPAK